VLVPSHTLGAWRRYLRKKRLAFSPRRSIGARVVLEPVARMPALETVAGERVITRRAALDIVRANRAVYAAADKLFVNGPRRA
jgi:transposase-like protein